jgi:hypothetical protein
MSKKNMDKIELDMLWHEEYVEIQLESIIDSVRTSWI